MPRAALLLLACAAPAAAQQLDPAALAKLKAATVFIKVAAGPRQATGSGFVVARDGPAAIVVTNAHVVDPAFREAMDEDGMPDRGDAPAPKLDVFFDSGAATERRGKGEILASDIPRDLAVLRVTGGGAVPAPLDLADPPTLLETMPVFVCGFPFGAQLAAGTKNPEISIGPASISSIRRDDAGRVAQVQLNGALNPGNSGGPVVAADGRLVGVAVTTVRGAGIGFAVPRDDVAAMLAGRLGAARLVPKIVGAAGETPCVLEVEVHDPLGRIKGITAHYKPVETRPPANQTPIGAKLLPGLTKLPLPVADRVAAAEIILPAMQEGVLLQVEIEYPDGPRFTDPGVVLKSVPRPTAGAAPRRAALPAVRLPGGQTLPYPAVRIPTDDDALSRFNRAPESFVGRALTIDALSNCAVDDRAGGYVLSVATDADRDPSNIKVTLPKDLGLQLGDLGIPDAYTFAVRVAGTVEKPKGRDGRYVLAADAVSFLDAAGAVQGTLKAETVAPAGEATLSAVNRFPEQYLGRTLTVPATLQGARYAGAGTGLDLFNENAARPLNLEAYTSKSLATQVTDELPAGTNKVRVTFTVDRIDAKTGHGILGVTKVESTVAGRAKTLTGDGAIQYPPAGIAPKPAEKPKPAAAAPPKAAEPAKEKGSNTGLMVGIAAGALTFLGVLVAAFFRLKSKVAAAATAPKYGRRADPEPEAPAKPKYGKKPEPPARGPAPPHDDFPGFG